MNQPLPNAQTQPLNHPNVRAILYLQVSLFSFLVGDSLLKLLLQSVPMGQLICLRTIASLLVLLTFMAVTGKLHLLKVTKPLQHALRSLFFTFVSIGYYLAVKSFSLSTLATALAGAPILISVISPLILKERANKIQWIATITGFIGVCFVLKPDINELNWYYLALLSLPFSYAIITLWAKSLSKTESDWSLNFYQFIPLLILSSVWQQDQWITPDARQLGITLISGAAASIGFMLLIAAFRIGKPVIIAPFEYSYILMALIADILFWHFYPDMWLWLGIGFILICGAVQGWQARIDPPMVTPHLRPEDTHNP
jgi:drug/metabolite transporter (DMT)-like permease